MCIRDSPQGDHCVMEATGKYHLRLAYALLEAGIRVSVVNPLSVKRFGQMLTSISKTDARDAVLLARYGQQQQPPCFKLPCLLYTSCYSSKDLYNWKNEGVVLDKGTIETFERPKVIYDAAKRQYVMWFHFDGNRYTLAELGVAVSPSPTGPFVVQKHERPNGHESRDIGTVSYTHLDVYKRQAQI